MAKVFSAERGRTITLICGMNAAGSFIPPAFVFPRKKTKQKHANDLLDSSPPDSVAFTQKSGWMTQELFPQYLEHFVKHTQPSQNSPVLVILDSHVIPLVKNSFLFPASTLIFVVMLLLIHHLQFGIEFLYISVNLLL